MGLRRIVCFSLGALVFSVFVAGAARLQEEESHREGSRNSQQEDAMHSHPKASQAAATPKGSTEKKAATVASQAKVSRGKKLFQRNCELCHEAESNTKKVGPGLKGLFKMPPHKRADGTIMAHHDEAAVREQIEEGIGQMPPMKGVLSKEEMDDLITYLRTL